MLISIFPSLKTVKGESSLRIFLKTVDSTYQLLPLGQILDFFLLPLGESLALRTLGQPRDIRRGHVGGPQTQRGGNQSHAHGLVDLL